MRRVKAALLAARSRFLASPDREHEMSVNRLVAAAVEVGLNAFALEGPSPGPSPLGMAVAYLAASVAICVHIVLRPGQTRSRRIFALACDVAAPSFEMHAGGAQTAWLYPAYLWIVFGNGFRFGPRPLLVAMAAGVFGFLAVVATTPFWSSKPTICAGLLLALLLIPLYTFSLLDKLSRARQQAVEANRAKSLFLAKVSHELRTPLNAIIGFGALLSDGRLDAEQRDMTQTILSSGRGLLSLIDSILDLSRLEAGRMPVSLAAFDLWDVLEDLRRMVLAQAREKRLHVGLHATGRTPARLRGDEARLREILLNLLSNAVKFTASGSVVLAVDATAVSGEAGDGEGEAARVRLRFEVDDTGIGIAPDAQGRIFEMFTQADETIATRYGGTGLGLSITRQLVVLLGGAIGVESQPGQGTTIWVELDMRLDGAAPAEVQEAAAARCLLVHDPAGVGAPVARGLRALGATVDALPAGAFDAAPGLWPELATGAAAVFAVIRHSCGTPLLSPGALLAADALRFFDVAPDAEPAPASRGERRLLATRVSALASPEELARALRVCGGFVPERADGAGLGGILGGVLGAGPEGALRGEPPSGRGFSRPPLVLVADDNRVNQKVMTRILERGGCRVILAEDGEEMLDVLETAKVDLVVADVNMPNVDGIEATQILRMTGRAPRVPVVGVTADATPQTRERCLAAGMDLCLLKPVEPAALLRVLQDLLAPLLAAADDADGAGTNVPGTNASGPRGAGAVRSIASHPRFRAAAAATIDADVLEGLRALGGDAFLAEVAADFLVETDELAATLRRAAGSGDVEGFRAGAHAIRSGAANVGARQLCDLAEQWETVSADQLRGHGTEMLSELAAHLARVRRALASLTGGRDGQEGSPRSEEELTPSPARRG